MTKLTLYYGPKQIKVTQDLASFNLHSDMERKNVVGKGIAVQNSYEETKLNAWSFEQVTYFLNDNKDTIFFQSNLFAASNNYIPGIYEFQIIGGSGSYVGATGTVLINVNKGGIRTVELNFITKEMHL